MLRTFMWCVALVGPLTEPASAQTDEQFVVAKGLTVQPFATQGQLSNPSSIDVDDRGRVWVAEAFNYRKKTRKAGDRILILEDSNGDGRADKTTVFYQNPDIDGVHGVCVLGNMAIISASDRILLLTDTDGDDKADAKKVLFTGKVLNPVNGQHDHAIHAVMFGPDGRLYFNFGNFNAGLWRADGTLVKDVFGNPVDNSRKPYQEGMVIRCELDGSKVEVLGHNFRNNWEVTVDSFGSMWQSDNDNGSSSCRVNFVMEYGNYGYRDERTGADYHSKRTNMEATMQRRMWHQNDPGVIPNLLITGSGAPTGILVYEGDLLPEPFRGQMIHAEPGRNVVWAFPAKQVGAGYSASIVDIVRSSVGRNYRPSDVSVAPDGSLFIADWFDPVDCCHRTINDAGRIFRVAPPKHAYAVPAYDFKTPVGAAKALRSPNLSARYKAWTALIGMQERARPALGTMASDDNSRFRARALWALAAIQNGTPKAIELALVDESENIRALGLRIARRHQLPVEPVVRQLVRDKSTLVRRECAVSLHRLTSAESVQLWTELAAQYDGKDRWYLEALGIGEKGKETACLNAWLKKTGKGWNSRAGRDIIWRLRAPETAALLAKLLLNASVPAAEHPRLLRALDFHDTQPKEAALAALLEGDAKHNPATYLEAFQRATPKFLEKHPEVLKRVESVMLASKGTVTFVDIVARFNRKDMVKHLMDMVQTAPEKEPGIRAIQQIFAFKEGLLIASALNKPNQAPALLKTLGFVGNDQAVAILRAVITDEARLEASRLLAITALGQSYSGAGVLMQLVQQKKLPAKFMPPAIQSLAASPGPNTRSFAAQHLNLLMPAGKRWPIELLLAAKPNALKGKAVFQKAGCIACHIVQGEGLDFGPELSDIGNKLSSEQLFEAILKPNQNISLGYEGVNVALKDGTQLIGFVASESKTVLSLRIPGGLRKDVPKADIKTRTAMKDSLMPIGLDAVISPQELVDLVGWLSPQLPELLAASIHGSPDVDIAVPNGTYTLQLLLYEGWRSRAADIVIEGKTVRAAYDMFKEQGGNFNQGSVLQHSFTLTDGNIDIQIKGPLHLGGLILSKGKGDGTVATAILKSKSDLDFKDVLKAINFGDTRNLSIGNVNFTAAAVNDTVDGVTNKAVGDVYAGEHNQKIPVMQKEKTAKGANAKGKPNVITIPEPGFKSIFNGKDLTGWEGEDKAWVVRDGAIQSTGGQTKKNWLIWRGGELRDFELRLRFKFTKGNSGVQVRSKEIDKWQVRGYQVEIADATKMGLWHHSLSPEKYRSHLATAGQRVQIGVDGKKKIEQLAEAAKVQSVCRNNEWNELVIKAVGSRLVQKINGVVFAELIDEEAKYAAQSGLLALQDHGKGCVAAFKDIRIKHLKAEAKPSRSNASKPNVVLIMSDDMGYSDLPKFGKSEIPTPNIDRLAKEGTLFTDAYVTAPICVASRMGLLTGQYQQRFGIYDNIYGEAKTRLFLNQTLLPAVFQDAGYRTAHVGKWHLSGNKRLQYETAGPRERGFDESIAILGGGSAFWKGTPVFRNGKEFPAPEYLTDYWGTEACAFIDRAHAQPFFLYLAYNAVHSPMHALDGDRSKFSKVKDENRRTYDGMLLAMDRSIGRVLDRLDKHGIADNTIVVFLNDNGGGGSTDLYAAHSRNYANNKPLSGHKFDVLEGGVRVPMIIRWPKHAPTGKVYGEMVSSTDVYPTLVAAAGLQMPKGQPTDGVDLFPFINGKKGPKPHDWLCWQNRSWLPRKKGGFGVPTPKVHNSAIRKGSWKLVRLNEKIGSDGPIPAWRLYDLTKDVGEQNDLADKHKEVVKELDAHFEKWRSSMHPTVE